MFAENLVEDLLKEEDGEREEWEREEQEQEGEEEECFPSHGGEEDPVTPCPTRPELEGIDGRGTAQKAAAQPGGGDTEDSQGTASHAGALLQQYAWGGSISSPHTQARRRPIRCYTIVWRRS